MEQKPSVPFIETVSLERFKRNGDFRFDSLGLEVYALATEEEKKSLRDSIEFQSALRKGMENLLSWGNVDRFKELVDLNLHTPETLQNVLSKTMEEFLLVDNIDRFYEVADLKLCTLETEQQIQPALVKKMEQLLAAEDFGRFLVLHQCENVILEETFQKIQPTLDKVWDRLLVADVTIFSYLFPYKSTPKTKQQIQPALQKEMERLLSNGEVGSFKELVDLNLHTFNVQDLPELQPALQKEMECLLLNGEVGSFKELVDLNLYQGDISAIFAQVIEGEGLTRHLNFLESFAPGFTEKLYTQISVFEGFIGLKEVSFDLLKRTLEQNPFLARALNHPYGARLLTEYPQLDTTSHQAIRTLFAIQEQATDVWDTNEYRLQAQAALSKLLHNKKTLDAIRAKGIHLEAWLHQDEEVYFSLGKEDEVGLGERIATPIKRLNETVDTWKKVVGSVLVDYKEELKNALLTEDIALLEEEKRKMETRLREVMDDDKKSQGIRKGIANLEARIAKPKQIQLWNKLTSDVVGIERLGKELVAQNTALIEQEEKLKTLSPKNAIAIKRELKALEQTLRESVNKLQIRFDAYYTNLTEVLTPVLTKDRAEALVQEMKHKLLEDQDHYQSDIRALQELFVQDKESESKLEGRPMRIRLASRHTNDLYIGNYTDCCVAIDNDVHGGESPIADYLTDLAIQIVIVEDMSIEPAMPVAAAWTFLGEDAQGNTSMVVDNIEGRGVYCASFKSDLEKRLGEYMERYAKSCGVGLSQGALYNDLIVTTVNGQDTYKKIGACTRLDGYYLEAERESGYEEDRYEEVDEDGEGGDVWEEEFRLDDEPLTEGELIQNYYDMSR